MKKLHMYAGLLSFSAFLIYGFAGLHGSFQAAPGERERPAVVETREIAFEAPGDMNDRELAYEIYDLVRLPYSGPPGYVRRDEEGRYLVTFFSVHGAAEVRYLEDEKLLRVERRRNDVWTYLNAMHAVTDARAPSGASLKLWGYYNEMALWCLFFMTLSGIYLWLASRPGMRWAQATALAGAIAFASLWVVTR